MKITDIKSYPRSPRLDEQPFAILAKMGVRPLRGDRRLSTVGDITDGAKRFAKACSRRRLLQRQSTPRSKRY
jgi:hypothetical protein